MLYVVSSILTRPHHVLNGTWNTCRVGLCDRRADDEEEVTIKRVIKEHVREEGVSRNAHNARH